MRGEITAAERDWAIYTDRYMKYIRLERGLADNTVHAYMHDVERLREFVADRYGGVAPQDVDARIIEDFMGALFVKGAESSTQGRMLSGISSFYDYLLRHDVIASSPVEFVEYPKTGSYLPETLSVEEIDAILGAIDLSQPQGYRNRTMIEMLYSCGLRVSELVSLHISDLFFDEGFIRVQGKGSKQRLVPVSRRCIEQVNTYLREYRPQPTDAGSADTLFLNRRGRGLSRVMVFNVVKDAAAMAGIDRDISPHTFRHSFATHMLKGGANIRQVQELLGHESVATTEIYTHLDTGHLARTLEEHHPLGEHHNGRHDG